ncbi:MAG: DUF2029 domain-containing protein [Syntrophales bacterium LBB04]|nr:DUF2029 domain-containing protein [Syntrophales bacterium LBB04]
MIKILAEDKWLLGITLIGLLLYLGFTRFAVLHDKPLDYYVYLIAAHTLGSSENIYTLPLSRYELIAQQLGIVTKAAPYVYPILTALLIFPLSFLPLRIGAAIWIGLSGVAALASGLVLCSFTDEKWKRRVILSSTIAFVPVLNAMNAGQVNLFVLLATALTLYYLHRGRDVFGGVAFSMGFWLKPFAIALIPLMVWRRKWKALIGFLLGSFLINFLSLAVFGISPTLSQFKRVMAMGAPAGLQVPLAGLQIPLNVQNLNGLLGRALAVTTVPDNIGYLLYIITAGLVGILTVGAIVFKSNERRFEMEAALFIAATHLIVPLTWYHHLTMMIIVFSFVIVYWHDFKLNSMTMLLLTGLVVTDMHGIFWKQLANLHPILSNFPVLTTLFLWWLTFDKVSRRQVAATCAGDTNTQTLVLEGGGD